MKIELSEAQEKAVLAEAAANLASRIQHHYGSDCLLDPAQTAARLRVSKRTVDRLNLPRVVLGREIVRYRLSDIENLIKRNLEK